jgi:DNA-binding transcriptional regulator YdaS (Cro superfamily)
MRCMLKSVEAVVEALGGNAATADLAGVGISAVSNWKTRRAIPAENFLTFSRALARMGKKVDPTVFGFKDAEAEA